LGRNYLTTTGFANTDLRLQRDFQLSESKSIRFSWEVFNVFNRSNHSSRFNFQGIGFRTLTSCTVVSGADCLATTGTPSNLSQSRIAVLNVDANYRGILDGVKGTADLSKCQATSCLSSASGAAFGPRDMQIGLKVIF
jgi:hypothetical protein